MSKNKSVTLKLTERESVFLRIEIFVEGICLGALMLLFLMPGGIYNRIASPEQNIADLTAQARPLSIILIVVATVFAALSGHRFRKMKSRALEEQDT